MQQFKISKSPGISTAVNTVPCRNYTYHSNLIPVSLTKIAFTFTTVSSKNTAQCSGSNSNNEENDKTIKGRNKNVVFSWVSLMKAVSKDQKMNQISNQPAGAKFDSQVWAHKNNV